MVGTHFSVGYVDSLDTHCELIGAKFTFMQPCNARYLPNVCLIWRFTAWWHGCTLLYHPLLFSNPDIAHAGLSASNRPFLISFFHSWHNSNAPSSRKPFWTPPPLLQHFGPAPWQLVLCHAVVACIHHSSRVHASCGQDLGSILSQMWSLRLAQPLSWQMVVEGMHKSYLQHDHRPQKRLHKGWPSCLPQSVCAVSLKDACWVVVRYLGSTHWSRVKENKNTYFVLKMLISFWVGTLE